jgi:hypothetical protein
MDEVVKPINSEYIWFHNSGHYIKIKILLKAEFILYCAIFFRAKCFPYLPYFEILFFNYCIFTIYSRYLKRVISKRDACEYLKQVPSIDGSLELI